MRTSGKVLKDFENLRKALFDEEISHMAFMRDGKVKILYTQKYVDKLEEQLQQKENIIKEVREDLYQVVKWCTENKHNEDTIERYLVVDYGTTVGKINEIRTKLDKEVN